MTTADVQAELDLRTDIKTNGVAIVERGSTRHYYKKLLHGWKHISTSTDASPSFDHEQTAEQRAEALKQTQAVEDAMKKWFAAQAQPRTRTIGDVDGHCPANPKGIKLRIPYDIAARDNWFSVQEFILKRSDTRLGRDEVFHASVTEMSDDGTDIEVEALVHQGPF